MLGIIVNVGAIIIGTIGGVLVKKGLKKEYESALFNAMGFAAIILGINAAVSHMSQSKYPVLFIVSLAVGSLIGAMVNIDDKFQKLIKKYSKSNLGQGLSTAILLCCIGTLSILGPVMSAIYGDNTFLYTNATLDFIGLSMRRMLQIAESSNVRDIAMPAIGAGLGGLNWYDVKRVIDTVSAESPLVNLYVVERYKPVRTTESFVEKHWEEEDVTFCLHFIGEEAVRQIEIAKDQIKCFSQASPFLYDQKLSELELSKHDYISKERFELIWREGLSKNGNRW